MNTAKKEKIKVFELDFGDTNVLDTNPKTLLDWIKADMEGMADDEELEYKITIRKMTEKQFKALPDWA